MKQGDLIKEILSTYQKHGWTLQRALLRRETRAQLIGDEQHILEGTIIDESNFDALWFSRPSHNQREAWELRLVAEIPYALFETFAADEVEELREQARQRMQSRMLEYLART